LVAVGSRAQAPGLGVTQLRIDGYDISTAPDPTMSLPWPLRYCLRGSSRLRGMRTSNHLPPEGGDSGASWNGLAGCRNGWCGWASHRMSGSPPGPIECCPLLSSRCPDRAMSRCAAAAARSCPGMRHVRGWAVSESTPASRHVSHPGSSASPPSTRSTTVRSAEGPAAPHLLSSTPARFARTLTTAEAFSPPHPSSTPDSAASVVTFSAGRLTPTLSA
jgi:hypothetical protein